MYGGVIVSVLTGDDRVVLKTERTLSVTMMAVLMMMLLLLMLTTTTLIKPTDAKVDVKAARAQLRAEWFNSTKFRRHSMDPDERYYFEQVRNMLVLHDVTAAGR